MDSLELIFFLGLVAATMLVSWAAAGKAGFQPAGSAGLAIRAFLDWAGMFVLFFAANQALGIASILLVRSLTTRFVSLYSLGSPLLIFLSALQAFVFQVSWKRD